HGAQLDRHMDGPLAAQPASPPGLRAGAVVAQAAPLARLRGAGRDGGRRGRDGRAARPAMARGGAHALPRGRGARPLRVPDGRIAPGRGNGLQLRAGECRLPVRSPPGRGRAPDLLLRLRPRRGTPPYAVTSSVRDVSIVIVNYDTVGLLRDCLQSLARTE